MYKRQGFCDGQRHLDHAQQRNRDGYMRHTQAELYAIPPLLVEDIFGWAQREDFA